jgi:hypothetical protein
MKYECKKCGKEALGYNPSSCCGSPMKLQRPWYQLPSLSRGKALDQRLLSVKVMPENYIEKYLASFKPKWKIPSRCPFRPK